MATLGVRSGSEPFGGPFAMQKVEGSSPFIRSQKGSGNVAFLGPSAHSDHRRICPSHDGEIREPSRLVPGLPERRHPRWHHLGGPTDRGHSV
jgi:hypothetical protein